MDFFYSHFGEVRTEIRGYLEVAVGSIKVIAGRRLHAFHVIKSGSLCTAWRRWPGVSTRFRHQGLRLPPRDVYCSCKHLASRNDCQESCFALEASLSPDLALSPSLSLALVLGETEPCGIFCEDVLRANHSAVYDSTYTVLSRVWRGHCLL